MEHASAGIVAICIGILLVAAISGRIRNSVITLPMAYVALGLVISPAGLGLVSIDLDNEFIQIVAEFTLVLVLASDASRIKLRALVRHHTIPARLLGIGLPLMMIIGTAAAVFLFDGLQFWEAAVLAIMLAPTDAGLGQAVVTNPNVPVRIRQALNIESGLNDGLAMPFLLLAVSFVEETERALGLTGWVSQAVGSLIVGALVGIAVGFLGGHLIAWGARSRWMSGGMQKISGIVLALLAYALADGFGGNGFIAAFCMGAAAANAAPPRLTETVRAFEEIEVEILMILTFMVVYGATMLPLALDSVTGTALIYAVLSLAIIRPLTVVLSLIGKRLQPLTVGFLGWFGPRGIASILYVFIVMETELAGMGIIYDTVMLTVLISIFAHGMTAAPGAKWYASRLAAKVDGGSDEMQEVPEMPLRYPVYNVASQD